MLPEMCLHHSNTLSITSIYITEATQTLPTYLPGSCLSNTQAFHAHSVSHSLGESGYFYSPVYLHSCEINSGFRRPGYEASRKKINSGVSAGFRFSAHPIP